MEMGKGTECGIGLEGFDDFQVDDQIQMYEEVKEKRTL
jgi:translation initiation factor IF-2